MGDKEFESEAVYKQKEEHLGLLMQNPIPEDKFSALDANDTQNMEGGTQNLIVGLAESSRDSDERRTCCRDSRMHRHVDLNNPCMPLPPLSQRQTSNGMTKSILYHKTHTAWQKSYCMSFAIPSYFPWIHGKTHVISASSYPWFFPCWNLSLVSQLFAFDSTF